MSNDIGKIVKHMHVGYANISCRLLTSVWDAIGNV